MRRRIGVAVLSDEQIDPELTRAALIRMLTEAEKAERHRRGDATAESRLGEEARSAAGLQEQAQGGGAGA